MAPMLVLGITGGIGSGKSLASEFFRSRGASILDADAVARELMGPGSAVLREVAAAFGPEVLRPDGSLDRRKLSDLVFGDPQAVARLNALTHPPIMAESNGVSRSWRERVGPRWPAWWHRCCWRPAAGNWWTVCW